MTMKHVWHQTRVCKAFMTRLGLQHPIVLAPMAGVCTPSLTAAVSNEGGLGMFGAAATPLEDLPGVIRDIKSLLKPDKLFGVNVFTPPRHVPALTSEQKQALEAVHSYYAGLAAQHHLDCNVSMKPLPSDDQLKGAFEAQIQVLLEHKVPIISFYFGLPEPDLLSDIKKAGVYTIGNATSLKEAQLLMQAGIDCIVVQGSEAGGHRATHYETGDYRPHMFGTTTLLALIAQHVKDIPLLASGGIMTGQQIVGAIAAGAAGVQLGTAFLTCPEAATAPLCKQLLLQEPDRGTTVSQVWTGRPARGLVTKVTTDLHQTQEHLPLGLYGIVNARPFHRAAAAAGLDDYVMQLCGQGYPLCKNQSAVEVFQELVSEADEAAEQLRE